MVLWHHEAFLPISLTPQDILRGQLAHSRGTFVPVFSKARGLRLQSSSWCARLSRTPTTTPHPPLPEALGFRWGLPYLLPTPLRILQEASRVHNGGLQQNAVGGVFLLVPSALCGSSACTRGSAGLPALPHAWQIFACIGPYSLGKYEVSGLLTDISSKVCQGVHFPKDYSRFV